MAGSSLNNHLIQHGGMTVDTGKSMEAYVERLAVAELRKLQGLVNQKLGQGRPKPRRVIDVVNANRYSREIQFVAVNEDVARSAAGEFGELEEKPVLVGRHARVHQPGWVLRVSQLYNFAQVRDYLKRYSGEGVSQSLSRN